VFVVWCMPGWCCGCLYAVPDVKVWRCPQSGAVLRNPAPRPVSENAHRVQVVATLRSEEAARRKVRLFEDACRVYQGVGPDPRWGDQAAGRP